MTKQPLPMRLALRAEGDKWNAYVARANTMKDAIWIGSIALRFIEGNDKRKNAFIAIMTEALGELIEEFYGLKPEGMTSDDEIAAFIIKRQMRDGVSPTPLEIGVALGLSRYQTILALNRLERRGLKMLPLKRRRSRLAAVPPAMTAKLLSVFEQIDAMRNKTDAA